MSISFAGLLRTETYKNELNSCSKQLSKTKTVADLNQIIFKVNKIQKEMIPPLQAADFNGINKAIKERSEKYTNIDYISDLNECKNELDKISYKDKRYGSF